LVDLSGCEYDFAGAKAQITDDLNVDIFLVAPKPLNQLPTFEFVTSVIEFFGDNQQIVHVKLGVAQAAKYNVQGTTTAVVGSAEVVFQSDFIDAVFFGGYPTQITAEQSSENLAKALGDAAKDKAPNTQFPGVALLKTRAQVTALVGGKRLERHMYPNGAMLLVSRDRASIGSEIIRLDNDKAERDRLAEEQRIKAALEEQERKRKAEEAERKRLADLAAEEARLQAELAASGRKKEYDANIARYNELVKNPNLISADWTYVEGIYPKKFNRQQNREVEMGFLKFKTTLANPDPNFVLKDEFLGDLKIDFSTSQLLIPGWDKTRTLTRTAHN